MAGVTTAVAAGGGAPPIAAEQAFLESVFLTLSQFAYDKAKDIVDKEKADVQKTGSTASSSATSGTSSSIWLQMLTATAQLINAEKAYSSLSLPQPRSFLKSAAQTLKRSYEQLQLEFEKLEVAKSRVGANSVDRLLAHLSGQLSDFSIARVQMSDFYEKLCLAGTSHVPYDTRSDTRADILDLITNIIHRHQKGFHHPILSSLKNSLTYEWESVRHLLQAHLDLQQWKFLPSLLHLQDAHCKLTQWSPVAVQTKESWSVLGWGSSTFGPKQSNTLPALYQWMLAFKQALLSKFTFYFYEVLSKQTSMAEMKLLTARTHQDYIHKISAFQRKNDVLNVSLVLDTHQLDEAFRGHGYHHPGKLVDSPLGLDSYPAVFTWPPPAASAAASTGSTTSTAADSRPTTAHWPSIVMMLGDRAHELSQPDRIVHFYDSSSLDSTYFLARVEPALTLVVICNEKKSEKDSNITSFVSEMVSFLNMTKLFAVLKPGTSKLVSTTF